MERESRSESNARTVLAMAIYACASFSLIFDVASSTLPHMLLNTVYQSDAIVVAMPACQVTWSNNEMAVDVDTNLQHENCNCHVQTSSYEKD